MPSAQVIVMIGIDNIHVSTYFGTISSGFSNETKVISNKIVINNFTDKNFNDCETFDDIFEAIEELKYYRHTVCNPLPVAANEDVSKKKDVIA